MKKIAFALLFSSAIHAQSTSTAINIFAALFRCPSTAPAIPLWTGTAWTCALLGTGLHYESGVIVAPAQPSAYVPAFTVETVSLTLTPSGAPTMNYTTLKPPIGGVVWWNYNSSNLFSTSSGVVAFTGQPLILTLPTGWLATDALTITYQYQ